MSFKYNSKTAKTFCPLAWIHSFINQDGSYQVCCTSEEFDNFIRDENGEVVYITNSMSSKDVMNTDFMKNLRLQMLNGEWPELCKRCEIGESMEGVSRRNVEVVNYKEINKQLVENTQEDGSISCEIKSADYRLGNLCNLQCRMCNPRSTALWIKEWNDMKPENEQFTDEVMDSYKKYDWIDSKVLVDDFDEKASSLEHIHFAGGEPLIVPQMRQILEKCIESGNAKNITITYNTNLTKLPEKVIELWKEFKEVKLLVSIDAIGELNHYIRYPSKWSVIDKNLKLIDQNHEEYNVSECMISATVQVLNVLKMHEMFEYLEQFKFIVPVPNLINLRVPIYFQTTILPPSIKNLATSKLLELKSKYEERLPDHYKYLTENISHIINFMNEEDDFAKGHFESFLTFQSRFDKERNLNLFKHYPFFAIFSERTKNLMNQAKEVTKKAE